VGAIIAAGAIILVGGRSSRMGQSKASLDFGGVPLLARIIAELRRRFTEIVVVAAPESDGALPSIPEDVLLLRDQTPFRGPADALRRALEAIGPDAAFACSCDLPLLDANVAAEIVAMLGDFDAAIPIVGEKLQPLHAAYRRRCSSALAAMGARGESRLSAIADAVNTRRIRERELRKIDPDLRSLFNVNTPEDYKRALELAGIAR
jgi:molybdopterin-guanine dinucleotide biosynthesis protein A